MKSVEAALFVSGKPMSAEELAQALGIASMGYMNRVLGDLVRDYESRNGALMISKIGEKYALSVRDGYVARVSSLAGAPEVSRGALRILAYISKNEPVMQNGIVKAFGSSTYDHVRELSEKDFIRSERVGRTKRIETTQKFREYFNV